MIRKMVNKLANDAFHSGNCGTFVIKTAFVEEVQYQWLIIMQTDTSCRFGGYYGVEVIIKMPNDMCTLLFSRILRVR